MKTRFATGLAVTALAILLTGCTGGGDTTPPPADNGTTEETPTTPETGAAELMTAESDLGEIVVDAEGMTVYMFDNDTQGSDTSSYAGDVNGQGQGGVWWVLDPAVGGSASSASAR